MYIAHSPVVLVNDGLTPHFDTRQIFCRVFGRDRQWLQPSYGSGSYVLCAFRLENRKYMIMPTIGNRKTTRHQISLLGVGRLDFITSMKTIRSRTKTMKPIMPPPAPYCHELLLVVTVPSARGAAKAQVARQSWRRRWNTL